MLAAFFFLNLLHILAFLSEKSNFSVLNQGIRLLLKGKTCSQSPKEPKVRPFPVTAGFFASYELKNDPERRP